MRFIQLKARLGFMWKILWILLIYGVRDFGRVFGD